MEFPLILKIFLVSLALFFLSGCAITQDPSYTGETSANPGTAWVPPAKELRLIKKISTPISPLLPAAEKVCDPVELLDIALTNHPQTRQAWNEARSQAFAEKMAKSTYFPTIQGSESLQFANAFFGGTGITGPLRPAVNRNTNTGPIFGPDQDTIGGFVIPGKSESVFSQLTISYLILDFGGREASVGYERQALFALNWTQNRTIQQVIINVIQAYYNYVNSKETERARQEDLVNAKVNLESAEVMYGAGLGRRLDVLQAQSNLENAQLELVTAKNQIKVNLGNLRQLLHA